MQDHDDFDFDDQPGIPAPLPPGEHVVWQGKPDKWELAKNAFHIRKIIIYFLVILGVQVLSTISSSATPAGVSLPMTLVLSFAGVLILSVLAWATAHVTIYTITNRRILIRFGVALQMTINLPFSQIKAADMRVDAHGFGDIPLVLKDTKRVNYLVLWPHVRPWYFSQPQPMLRSIANVEQVAHLVGTMAAESPEISQNMITTQTKQTVEEAAAMQSEAL